MASALPTVPLQPGYYLDNFEAVLVEVEERSYDLLVPAECQFLEDFRRLGRDARRLYVRLVSRRGPWFRPDRWRYPEIAAGATEELLAAGLAETGGEGETLARLALLVRAELLELAAEFAPPGDREFARRCRALSRSALGEAVADAIASDAGREAIAVRFPMLRLLALDAVRVFRLLFFGNLAQDWTEFVLADLGVVRFEPYPRPLSDRPFANRDAVDEVLELRQLEDAVGRLLAGGEVDAARELAAVTLGRTCAGPCRRYRDRLAIAVARALERRSGPGDWDVALLLYAAASSPPARERRVRVLRRLGRADEAATLVAAMRAAPFDESERIFADRDERGRRRRRPVAERTVRASRGLPVEQAALAVLAGEGYRGFFAENWLWRSLFGLAFWDIVFAPVPGAFTNRFQLGPRDLHDGFRAAREDAIAARLDSLRGETHLAQRLLAVWDQKFGVANRLVTFLPELRPHIELASGALGGAQLAGIADRLSRDLRRYGSGFPDLFLVGPKGDLLLAEVKGPGDQLRPEQEGWLEYLDAQGLPAIVLQVPWNG